MKLFRAGFVWLTATTIAVSCGLLVIYRNSLPPQVPLWYSRPWGQDQLASPLWLWLIPSLIAVVAAVVSVGSQLAKGDRLLLALWLIGGGVVQLILGLSLVRIVWLVIF